MSDKEKAEMIEDEPVAEVKEATEASAQSETSEAEQIPSNESAESELLKKLEAATAEAQELRERYIRSVAEMENFRKRAVRERDEVRRQAGAAVVEDMLPVLENLTLGLQSAEQHEAGKVFLEGFKMVHTQLKSALESNGVQELKPIGEAFDPNWHESVAQVPHESVEEGKVIEVQRVGYRYHDRLLRPAMVIVSSGPAQATETAPASEDSENVKPTE